ETRVHCSQPSIAAVSSASRALALNAAVGDAVRARLAALIRRFNAGLANLGHTSGNVLLPIQVLDVGGGATALHERLGRLGISALLLRVPTSPDHVLGFHLTPRHSPSHTCLPLTRT